MNNGGGAESGGGGMVAMRSASPFTVSQWQELEHQALIFKYMMAGLPVPPDLVLPIQKSFDSISNRFFPHPSSTMGYCSFYGKKVDPEPGRCRRTDGKKWRCSKDAYPDSKYCERHMHRGRNRSRKLVESQTMTQSSSTVTSLTVSGSTGGGTGSFQSLPLHAFGSTQVAASPTGQSNYHLESIPYGIPRKDYRYLQGIKPDVGGHSLFTDASGSNRDTWPLMQSRVTSFPQPKKDGNPIPQHSFFSNFDSADPVKHEVQSLRPFFDE